MPSAFPPARVAVKRLVGTGACGFVPSHRIATLAGDLAPENDAEPAPGWDPGQTDHDRGHFLGREDAENSEGINPSGDEK